MRRSHDRLTAAAISIEPTTGEVHRRHHISPTGYYRGRQALVVKVKSEEDEG
jgi:large subunit ribosomal protein L32